MKKHIEYESVSPIKLGPSTIGIAVPLEWCAHNKIDDGQTIYCSGLLAGEIEYHLKHRQWSKPVTLSTRGGSSPFVSIPAAFAGPRGITTDSRLARKEQTATGSLLVTVQEGA
jgi:hypothetical protein